MNNEEFLLEIAKQYDTSDKKIAKRLRHIAWSMPKQFLSERKW